MSCKYSLLFACISIVTAVSQVVAEPEVTDDRSHDGGLRRRKRVVNIHNALETLASFINGQQSFENNIFLELSELKNQSQDAHLELDKIAEVLLNASKNKQREDRMFNIETQLSEIGRQMSHLRDLFNRLLCPHTFLFAYDVHKCYKIIDGQVDWDTAKLKCSQDSGAKLVAIKTKEDTDAIQTLLGRLNKTDAHYWTAGKGRSHGRQWRWGEEVNGMSYTNWASGYPRQRIDSNLLTQQHLDHLSTWLPNKRLRLLYRATRDGMSPATFHSRCDNQGPTISVAVEPSSGTLFGGYTSRSWTSSGGSERDDNAFIFQVCDGDCTTVKYDVIPGAVRAVYDTSSCGPVFGQDELVFFYNVEYQYDSTNGHFSPNSLCNSARDYSGHLSCSDDMKLRDVEVFAVEDDLGHCMALQSVDGKWIDAPCQDQHGYICEV